MDHRTIGGRESLVQLMTQESTTFEAARQAAGIAAIKAEVARDFGYSVRQIDSRMRDEPLTAARHAAMTIARDLTEASFPDLARAFNRENHNSVRHALDSNAKRRKASKRFRLRLDAIEQRLHIQIAKINEGTICQTTSQ